jgi:hypothetical protein
MATVADRHPPGAPAETLPRLAWALKVKPVQLAGGGVTLWTRLGDGRVLLLTFCNGVFLLQPLILPGGFNIFPRKRGVFHKIIFIDHNRRLDIYRSMVQIAFVNQGYSGKKRQPRLAQACGRTH